jgi:AcrR family transcriptional regulator
MSTASDDASRHAILEAALSILTAQGHHALTVRRVASEAGCSTIGVYTWFGGKDGLVDALWIEAFSGFGEALRKARPRPGPLGRLRAQAFAYRKWALSHPSHYQLLFFNVIPDHEPSAEALTAALGAYSVLLSAVEEGRDRLELRVHDMEAVAHVCWATVHGLVSLQLAQAAPPGRTETELFNKRAFELAIDMLMTGLTSLDAGTSAP